MRRLFRIAFASFPRLSAVAFLCAVLSVGVNLPAPLLTVYLIDKVFPSRNFSSLNLIGFALVGFLLLNASSGFLSNYFSSLLFEKIAMKFGIDSFRSLLDSYFFSSFGKPAGYWANRIQSDPQSVAQLFKTLIDLLTHSLMLVVGMFFIFYFSANLGLLVLLILPFYLWALSSFGPKMKTDNKATKEEKAKLSGFIEETLSGIETIKAFSIEPFRKRELEEIWDGVAKTNVRYTLTVATGSMVATLLASIAPVAVLWYGGYLVMTSGLTLGKLIGINKFLSYVFGPIAIFMGINSRLQNAQASLDRIDEIKRLPKECTSGNNIQVTDNTPIEVEDLRFSYGTNGQQHMVFDSLNLKIPGGKTTALVGESGCGKTTLLRIINGMLPPASGRVLINKMDVSTISRSSLREKICLIPQNSFLFSGDIAYNILMGTDVSTIDEGLLDAAGIRGFHQSSSAYGVDSLLEYEVGPRGSMLSGGQRQRVALARALVRQPIILLMDEVTSEIDAETEFEIVSRMTSLRKGKTTLLVAHRVSAIRSADEIIVLSAGRVAERGTHQELLKANGIYKRLWTAQIGEQVSKATKITS